MRNLNALSYKKCVISFFAKQNNSNIYKNDNNNNNNDNNNLYAHFTWITDTTRAIPHLSL